MTSFSKNFLADSLDKECLFIENKGQKEVSCGQFKNMIQTMRVHLLAEQLQEGDLVLPLVSSASVEFYAFMIAVLSLKATLLIIEPTMPFEKVASSIESMPALFFISESPEQKPKKLINVKRHLLLSQLLTPLTQEKKSFSFQIFPEENKFTALFSFTSGSSGAPKMMMRSLDFLLGQLENLQCLYRVKKDETQNLRYLTTLPLFIFPTIYLNFITVLPPFHVISPRKIDAHRWIEYIAEHNVTAIMAPPSLLRCLLDAGLRSNKILYFMTGGGPVPHSLHRALKQACPTSSTTVAYGSTEAEPIAVLQGKDYGEKEYLLTTRGKGILAGTPASSLDLRVIRDLGGKPLGPLTQSQLNALTLPEDEIGEIIIQGANIINSYVDKEQTHRLKIPVDGSIWHRTGDSGYLDTQKRLWLTGRCEHKVQVKSGEVFYPFQIEQAILALYPKAHFCAVLEHAQEVVLCVEEADEFNVAEEIKERFHIDKVVKLKEVPTDKRHNSKVDYKSLRELIERTIPLKV